MLNSYGNLFLLLSVILVAILHNAAVTVAQQLNNNNSTTVTLGVLFAASVASDAMSIPHSVSIAQAYIASRPDLFSRVKFDFQVYNTMRNLTLTQALFSQLAANKAVGVVGPRFSLEAENISPHATSLNLPYLGYTSTASSLSNKTLHPMFSRVIPPDSLQTLAIVNLLYVYEWYV